MPLYEYQCDACGQRFEVIQKFSDAPIAACRKCGTGPVQKLQSSPAFQFKGSGWYITDYAKKSNADGGSTKAEAKSEATSESQTESKTESKAESKAESKTEAKADAAAKSESKTP